MRSTVIRSIAIAGVALAFGLGSYIGARAEDVVANKAAWDSIRKDEFGTRDILDGAGKILLEAPIRAEDAATVPISIDLPAGFAGSVKSLTLIVDQNPAPIVATFNYGEAAGSGERRLATRIRIDQYSDVRVIAETTDGKLYMTAKFVKASGGCSAPASKDAEEAARTMGKMKIQTAVAKSSDGESEEAQVMLKHPNTSGMAMNQVTRDYPPARFISSMSVTTAGKLVFAMQGGISISEDPNFRFTYKGNPTDEMAVKAEDSAGTQFSGHSTQNPS